MNFRNYIRKLNELEKLYIINDQVNWKYEIGEICRKNKRKPILFKSIKDYKGWSLFTGGFSSEACIGSLFGLSSTCKVRDIVSELKRRKGSSIKPVMEEHDQEEYEWLDGKNVNLYELPVPWWHPLDAGRYVGTWHINISKDSSTGIRNIGVYRMQIKGRNYASISVSPESHLAKHVKNAEIRNIDLPVATAIGVDEILVLAGAAAMPENYDEYELAGAIQGCPIKLVKGKTVDLEIPSEAEIVLEGVIRCGVRLKDGPFFDYSGKVNINPNAYCFEVRAIKRKYNPIFRGMAVGEPGAEDHNMFSILSQLSLVNFHGSEVRQKIQNYLLKKSMYKTFQFIGRCGSFSKNIRR